MTRPIRNNELLELVKNDLEELFKDDVFMTSTGEERPLKFFKNEISAPTEDEEADPALINAPYCLIKFLDGSFTEWNYTRKVNIAVIFCLFDSSTEMTGHDQILDMIDRVFEHYAQTQMIGNSLITLPIEWTNQTDVDTFPFCFGAFSLELESEGEKIRESDLT